MKKMMKLYNNHNSGEPQDQYDALTNGCTSTNDTASPQESPPVTTKATRSSSPPVVTANPADYETPVSSTTPTRSAAFPIRSRTSSASITSLASDLSRLRLNPDDRPVVTLFSSADSTSTAPSDKVKFVCVSDTHNRTHQLPFPIPDGDVLIHAGDFTMNGQQHEIASFNDWLGHLPHKHKVVIAGNHETMLDGGVVRKPLDPHRLLTNCTYLQDSHTTIHGIKIYGAPWTPEYYSMAFNVQRGESSMKKWNKIPKDTDILVTHGPPYGKRDVVVRGGYSVGCESLMAVVERVKPKYHVFGHIHEGYGTSRDEHTVYVNAAMCNTCYRPVNPPLTFELPVPPAHRPSGIFPKSE